MTYSPLPAKLTEAMRGCLFLHGVKAENIDECYACLLACAPIPTAEDWTMIALRAISHMAVERTERADAGYRRARLAERALKEMLDAYWGEGDGGPPPSFVQRAIDLIGWEYKK